jgi:hypothetical protein
VRHTATSPPLMTTDYTRFVWLSCELDYPRAYRARRDALLCRGGDGNLSAVTGFSTNDVVVLDVTERVPRAGRDQPSTELSWEGAEAVGRPPFPSGGTRHHLPGLLPQRGGAAAGGARGAELRLRPTSTASPTSSSSRPRGGAAVSARRCSRWRSSVRRRGCARWWWMSRRSTTSSATAWSIRLAIQAFCRELKPRGLRYLLLAGAGCFDFRHQRLSVNDYTACLIPTLPRRPALSLLRRGHGGRAGWRTGRRGRSTTFRIWRSAGCPPRIRNRWPRSCRRRWPSSRRAGGGRWRCSRPTGTVPASSTRSIPSATARRGWSRRSPPTGGGSSGSTPAIPADPWRRYGQTISCPPCARRHAFPLLRPCNEYRLGNRGRVRQPAALHRHNVRQLAEAGDRRLLELPTQPLACVWPPRPPTSCFRMACSKPAPVCRGHRPDRLPA